MADRAVWHRPWADPVARGQGDAHAGTALVRASGSACRHAAPHAELGPLRGWEALDHACRDDYRVILANHADTGTTRKVASMDDSVTQSTAKPTANAVRISSLRIRRGPASPGTRSQEAQHEVGRPGRHDAPEHVRERRPSLVGQHVEEPAVEDHVEGLTEGVDGQRVMDEEAGVQTALPRLGLASRDRCRGQVDARGTQPALGGEQRVLAGAASDVEYRAAQVAGIRQFNEGRLWPADVPRRCPGVRRVPVARQSLAARRCPFPGCTVMLTRTLRRKRLRSCDPSKQLPPPTSDPGVPLVLRSARRERSSPGVVVMAGCVEHLSAYGRAWNEPDRDRRRELLRGALTGDARYSEPGADITGPDAVADLIGRYFERYEGFRIWDTSEVDGHHDAIRFAWAYEGIHEGRRATEDGADTILVAEDGRLSRIIVFFGASPPPLRSCSS